MTTKSKDTTRFITLYDRPPVKIDEDAWPIIASTVAFDDERVPAQANREWHLKIRQEKRVFARAPRYIVYGVYTSAFEHEADRRGGFLVDEPQRDKVMPTVVRAVWDLVERLGFEARLGDEVIAALPAEEL
jgi:hypothetical protein